jgi:folate-dependent phosphoribosylglycinamide formyltransferase PurN
LGWFSTGRGEGSRGLLQTAVEASRRGELDARILFVFCNRDPGEHAGSDEFMALVKSYDLPLVTLSSQGLRRAEEAPDFASVRLEFDRQVLELLASYTPDMCVLAGYGLIFGPEVVRRYTLLNLHPALPGGPTGSWQEVIWQLIEARAPETGTMVHLGTEELDRGPPLSYFSLSLVGDNYDRLWRQIRGRSMEAIKAEEGEDLPLFRRIRQEMVRRERPLLLETLKALADGRVRVVDGRVVDEKGIATGGLCLNLEVERAALT